MHEKLEQRLLKFGEDENWAGMGIEDLELVTNYTLKALVDHLSEDTEHGGGEAAAVGEVIELLNTHLLD